MRLRTKFQDEDFKLGEVVDADIFYGGNGFFKVTARGIRGGIHTFYFYSLKELNDMFEDYEEPKDYYLINLFGEVSVEGGKYQRPGLSELGLTFETKEEAEKAVKKLKAWKRLKDKGFRFDGWEDLQAKMDIDGLMIFNRDVINTDNVIGFRMDDYHDCFRDLNILFGGEE